MKLTIPTILSFLRILLIPVIGVIYYIPGTHSHFIAALVFVVAGVSDWLDGYLARNLQQMTRFGAFIDPVADKLLVAISLILILGHNQLSFLTLPVVVIVGREIVVSALREWMAEVGKRASVKVVFIAKVKTAFQMAAIGFLLWYHADMIQAGFILWLGTLLLYVAAGLTVWTMLIYLKTAWKDLTFSQEKQ